MHWCNRCLYGIAKLRGHLFVLFDSVIGVYEADSQAHIKEQPIKKLRHEGDIVACRRTNNLYIIENHLGIFKYQSAEILNLIVNCNYYVNLLWLASSNCVALSVAENGNLLIVTEKPLPRLEVFDENASLVKLISLPMFILKVYHAITMLPGTFILSFASHRGRVHNICQVNENGEVLNVYEPEIQWHQLLSRHHLAADSDGNVYITDEWNHRVIRLDKTLKFDQAITSVRTDGFQSPVKVSFDTETNLLLVTHGCRMPEFDRRGDKVEFFIVKDE